MSSAAARAGSDHSCGLRLDATIACWGRCCDLRVRGREGLPGRGTALLLGTYVHGLLDQADWRDRRAQPMRTCWMAMPGLGARARRPSAVRRGMSWARAVAM